MNDFGGTFGGPLIIPHVYSGHDRTFFFTSFEGLRLPRQTPFVESVPSMAMRQGLVGDYLYNNYCQPQPAVQCPKGYTVYNPDGSVLTSTVTNTPVPVTPIAANVLQYLFPKPNTGPVSAYSNNFALNMPTPVSTNQGDVRVDQILSSRQSMFARFSYKNRQVVTAPQPNCGTSCYTSGDLLFGGFNTPEIDEGMTLAHNFQLTPSLMNEFRAGYNAQHTSTTQSFSTQQILTQTGINVPQVNTLWSESPNIVITGFAPTGGGNPSRQRGQIIQALDNLTWTKQHHNLKFGADFKRMNDHDDNVFGNYSSGWFVFDSSSAVGTTIADPYTAFLLGYPDYTEASTVNQPAMTGLGYAYAFYGQDDWKATPNLTLNLGLRYELHPPLVEQNANTAFFLPDYTGTVGGEQITGAVVVPNQKALSTNDPSLAQAITPTPFFTAQQANLPSALRFTDKNDWGPRIGFAWRPYGPTAMTRQFCGAAGGDSSKLHWAFPWWPDGRSTQATPAITARRTSPTASPRSSHWPTPSQPPPTQPASPAPPPEPPFAAPPEPQASTTPSPSTTATPQFSNGT
jgi:outer membrane receptor protein involved in Fe transport